MNATEKERQSIACNSKAHSAFYYIDYISKALVVPLAKG